VGRAPSTIAAALAALLACSSAASAFHGDDPPIVVPGDALAIARDPIVWIDEGEVTLGATRTDVAFAILLCQDEHDLAVAEGCAAGRFAHELGTRRVHLPTFGIDRTEVTHAAWRRCMAAGRCVPPRVAGDDPRLSADAMPVSGITLAEAADYCAHAGGRLPTEEEWEKAARGDSARRFPWGSHYHARLANHGRPPLRPDPGDGFRWAAPVGSFPDGASPYGVLDMAGNVY
jgi:sulfatase modifying factor 1